jgi:hypothetical protein
MISTKILLTSMLCLNIAICSAQKQLLSYPDLQYLMQNKTDAVTNFLKQKDYFLQPATGIGVRFFTLYADADYTDISIASNNRHTIISLSTTDSAQVAILKKALSIYSFKNSKGAKVYKIKDGTIATAALKENDEPVNANKPFIVKLEN